MLMVEQHGMTVVMLQLELVKLMNLRLVAVQVIMNQEHLLEQVETLKDTCGRLRKVTTQ